MAAAVALDTAQRCGLRRLVGHRIALVTGELATNVLKHGGGGSIEIHVSDARVDIRATDHGPGLPQTVTVDGVEGRVAGPFAGGWGLEVIARASDVVQSGRDPNGGAWVEATLWLDRGQP